MSNYNVLIRKYYENDYFFYYSKNEVLKAFAARVKHAIELVNQNDELEKVGAYNYLHTISSNEILSVLKLDQSYEESFQDIIGRKHSNLFIKENIKKKNIDSLLYIGPSAKLEDINLSNYSHICLNKPISMNISKKKNIILITNNIFSSRKSQAIFDWCGKYINTKLYSPRKLGIDNENNTAYNQIPFYPFRSGLMGFQRSLHILFNNYDIKKIHVIGFDFSLSEKPYKSFYPSLFKEEGYNNITHNLHDSYKKHDFLLNYQYAKKIIIQYKGEFSGSVLPFLSMDLRYVLDLFSAKVVDYK